MTPLERLARWWATREDRPRVCEYGAHPGETTEPRCGELITLRGSEAGGHRGYCSHRHAALAQADAPM